MGRHCSGSSFTPSDPGSEEPILQRPFGEGENLTKDELRETAYELFFASCRSSPGFGGKHPLTFYSTSPAKGSNNAGPGGANMSVNSRIKRALGLRTRKGAAPHTRMMTEASNMGPASPGKAKLRPMTSAEIVRQQMGVTEQSDSRLRKTLMRAFVGQTERRAETIILPLELLRQLKPSEFSDVQKYHQWQQRQLRVLEAGLTLHPLIPLDRPNPFAAHLADVVRSSEHRPIDTSKNSHAMRTLCNAVPALAWRTSHASLCGEACHWADGYPFNVHLYLSLLICLFDQRDRTVVLDEVDELVELIKKTWPILGIGRMTHNVCFTWVLFEQYVVTGQVEPDLICAASTMLSEVANDVKKADKDPGFVKVASAALSYMLSWAESKLLNYHEGFEEDQTGVMDDVLGLALSIAKISEDIPTLREDQDVVSRIGNRVDFYIRSSLRNAFNKACENSNGVVESNEGLVRLATETERLAIYEKENFSPVLKRWHPVPAAVAVATLHGCFGGILKRYMTKVSNLSNESIGALQTAGKLEKVLVQMVVEDSVECEDGGKGVVREMVPYEVDTVIMSTMKDWIAERLRTGKDCLTRAKETESWNPKSKSEPYAQSAEEITKLAKATVDDFFEIPASASEELVQDLADGLENLFQDYICFISSCGSKQNYVPTLPPLTRCNQDPTLVKLWQKASAPCTCAGAHHPSVVDSDGSPTRKPRPTTSRGTQRLYVRLNTLHYLLSTIHSVDKSLSVLSLSGTPSHRQRVAPSHFDLARSSVQSAILHVSEVAAYRLVFVDSAHQFYDSLYANGVGGARLEPRLRTLRQNLTLLAAVLTDRAQAVAVREVMKAAFEAFLMVLLAGGSRRWYDEAGYGMVVEDLRRLKGVFCAAGEGLVAEEVVEREAEVVEGIVELMGLGTERLIEDFTTTACEASGVGGMAVGAGGMKKVPMPPTTGRWSRVDPNTLLRVLCHRNDEVASAFLKRAFQLPKRK